MVHAYQVHQQVAPLKNFANFSGTIERYDIKIYALVTPIELFANLESFIILSI